MKKYFLTFAAIFTVQHIIADVSKYVFYSDFLDTPSMHIGFYISGFILGFMIDVTQFKKKTPENNQTSM